MSTTGGALSVTSGWAEDAGERVGLRLPDLPVGQERQTRDRARDADDRDGASRRRGRTGKRPSGFPRLGSGRSLVMCAPKYGFTKRFARSGAAGVDVVVSPGRRSRPSRRAWELLVDELARGGELLVEERFVRSPVMTTWSTPPLRISCAIGAHEARVMRMCPRLSRSVA